MAASLPGLPAELLLKIIGHEHPYWHKRAYALLRATCRELNKKLLYFFGFEYFHRIRVTLARKGVSQLQAISKSSVAVHTKAIQLHVSTLFTHVSIETDQESTDASRCSWFSESELLEMGSLADQFQLDEDVAEFITGGLCSQILGEALSQFPNVNSLVFMPPVVHSRMANDKLEDVKSRWLLACKVLLLSVLTKATGCEHLEIVSRYEDLPVPLRALDVTAYYSTPHTCLKRFHMDFIVNVREASYPVYIKLLVQLLAKMPVLVDLAVSFKKAPSEFFKQLARTLPELKLRKLKLAHIVTRYKYLFEFIDSSIPTLESLTLDCLDLTRPNDHEPLCYSLPALIELDECVLRGINVQGQGLRFGKLNAVRSELREGHTYKASYELSARMYDEDDPVEFWELAAISCELGQAWPRST